MGRRCSPRPVPSRLRDLGERRKLPQWGLGHAEPQASSDFVAFRVQFYAISRIHLSVHLTAARKWEIPTSLYWLV